MINYLRHRATVVLIKLAMKTTRWGMTYDDLHSALKWEEIGGDGY